MEPLVLSILDEKLNICLSPNWRTDLELSKKLRKNRTSDSLHIGGSILPFVLSKLE